MDLKSAFLKIDRYLKSDRVGALAVDVQNRADRKTLIDRYDTPRNTLIRASDAEFCRRDELPDTASLLNRIGNGEGNLFVLEFSFFLKLQGEEAVKQGLRQLLQTATEGHVVLITFQCAATLRSLMAEDVRMRDRICLTDGNVTPRPDLIFTRREFPADAGHVVLDGIDRLAEAAESRGESALYVATEKSAATYPRSVWPITEEKRAYQILCHRDSQTAALAERLGTEEEWQYALSGFQAHPSWEQLIAAKVGDTAHPDAAVFFWQTRGRDPLWRWLWLIDLKLFGAGENDYLRRAAERADSTEELVRSLYRLILEYDPKDPAFQGVYADRRELLETIGHPPEAVADFCRIVPSREKDALYYLTDGSRQEKELIFRLLDRYGEEWEREELLDALQTVYPDLWAYLLPFRFKNELLDSYFQDYKYQKVINRVFPEFLAVVEEQAEKRSYNAILPPRCSVAETVDRAGAQTYFTDALGAEYLGFILHRCGRMHLMAKVTVCRCELPSVTVRNKEFWDAFDAPDRPILAVRELDDIKHHGKYGYDYQKTKLPIHLIRELEVIDELLEKICSDLTAGKYQKAILISDHGASRLAVIHATESSAEPVEMEQSGEHSGRCCPKSALDVKPDHAADADDFWALADYGRFKGGRRSGVEVHGGATLEEVTVPILEITSLNSDIEVRLMPIDAPATFAGIPEITVSYRKKAALKIFATQNLRDVSLRVDGHSYDAEPAGEQFYVVREMPELRRAGDYNVDVLACGIPVATGLPLRVRREVAAEKDLF